MRRFRPVLCLVLLVACTHPKPADLVRTAAWPTAREHGRYVTVHDLRLFAITLGKGRDVVLLHGNPASTYSWRKVMEPLAARYRVHAIDLPGFGFSDKPADASYDIGWLTTAVLGYLDAERIPRAVLVGNSMGGAVATETAIVEPGRVVALVLLGAAGLPEAETAGPPLSFRMLTWRASSFATEAKASLTAAGAFGSRQAGRPASPPTRTWVWRGTLPRKGIAWLFAHASAPPWPKTSSRRPHEGQA